MTNFRFVVRITSARAFARKYKELCTLCQGGTYVSEESLINYYKRSGERKLHVISIMCYSDGGVHFNYVGEYDENSPPDGYATPEVRVAYPELVAALKN